MNAFGVLTIEGHSMKIERRYFAAGMALLGSVAVFTPAVAAELSIVLAPESGTTAAAAGKTRLRVTMSDASAQAPAEVQFINVPGLPAGATNVEVILVYRDSRGTTRETTPGLFEQGCLTETTDDGVDVVCPVAAEAL